MRSISLVNITSLERLKATEAINPTQRIVVHTSRLGFSGTVPCDLQTTLGSVASLPNPGSACDSHRGCAAALACAQPPSKSDADIERFHPS
jgi:hypothetical protein